MTVRGESEAAWANWRDGGRWPNWLAQLGRARTWRRWMAGSWTRRWARLPKLLATVTGQDLEQDAAGVFRIARKVAADRVISVVDPQARHGHKTSHKAD